MIGFVPPVPAICRRAAVVAAAIVLVSPAAAQTAPRLRLDLPQGSLSRSLVELARQAKIPIGMADPSGGDIRTPAVKGTFSVEEALRRLLAGTGYRFRRTPSGDYVVVRAAPPRAAPKKVRPPEPRSDPPSVEETVIVTASKRASPLSSYPGSVTLLALDGDQVSTRPEGGTAILIDNMPVLAATNLGPGRNKIFARGIADSSFNGQSQANVSLYFGELRLAYSGPDPDLNLFDVRRVETLTGPYGTLYGTGAMGGVMRIEPNAPDPKRVAGKIAAHVSDVWQGASGGGAAGMVNLPIVSDRLALRAVGYHVVDPGFIDDTLRGLKDVNRVTTTGARGTLRFESGDDFSVDLGLIFQRIDTRDSQYSNDSTGLTKHMARAQPYSSDYLMPSVTLRKSWGDLTLVSATGWSRQRGEGVLEYYGAGTNSETVSRRFLSHETRLSSGGNGVRFVAGLNIARNVGDESREVRVPGFAPGRFQLSSHTTDVAVFGEASIDLSRTLAATIGGRLNFIRDARTTIYTDLDARASAARSRFGVIPSASIAWKPGSHHLIFLAYRSGTRGGNVLPVRDSSGPQFVTSNPDRLHSVEAGWRYSAPRSVTLSATLSYTRWDDIQSDLITVGGNSRTVNLGRTSIWGLEAAASWRPVRDLTVAASMFLNNSPSVRLDTAALSVVPMGNFAQDNRVPNIATMGARATLVYETGVFPGARARLAGAMRYYGASVAEFRSVQPEYMELGADARLILGRWAATLGVTNLSNVRGNRFAIGNMFYRGVGETQSTPLQPRTVRIGLEVNL